MKGQRNRVGRQGTSIVEMALVLPVLLLLILGGLDFALQFHVRHCMTNAAREAARCLAVRGGSVADATSAATEQLSGINAPFTITATPPPDGQTDVVVRISVPRAEVSLGMFALTPGATIAVQTTMRKEQ